MRYAFFDQQGRVESAHNDDTVLNIPDGAVELSEVQWDDRFNLRLTNGELTNDPIARPIADIKADVWGKIKTERDRRKSLGFQCAGNWYHSDGESKTQHLGNKDTARDQLAAGAQPGDPLLDPISGQAIIWKTMSGQFVPLTCSLALDIVAAGKSAEFQVFAVAEMHRAQMLASPDPAAYDFSGGWPTIFAG